MDHPRTNLGTLQSSQKLSLSTLFGINKRNLEKHIRELYRRKGTKEGAKLFMKILLDETSDIFYPNCYFL